MINGVIKFGIIFLIASILLSLFNDFVGNVFNFFGMSINYMSTGNVGVVVSSIISFFAWLLDLLFLDGSLGYDTLINAPTIHIASISWTLTIVRVVLGVSLSVVLISLIFGKMRK